MSLKKLMTSITAVAVLALLSQAASESNADHALATTNAIAVNTDGDDTVRQSDFDGDGTFVFSDLIAFASQFGKTVSRRPTLKNRRTAGSWDKVESLERDTV